MTFVAHHPFSFVSAQTPAAALDILQQRKAPRIFSTAPFGGYLMSRDVKVFIDGRAELYGEEFVMDYFNATEARNVGELLSTYRRLKKAGIVPYRPIHHGPTLSMYYHDPDGNSVEMQVDCFKTKAEASAYFQTESFTKNPIGVNFDPETLVAAYESGASEAELLRQPDGPMASPQGL